MKTNILFLILACTGVIFGVSGLTRKFLAKSDDKQMQTPAAEVSAAQRPPADGMARRSRHDGPATPHLNPKPVMPK